MFGLKEIMTKPRFWLSFIFLFYLVLRIYAWSNVTVLEDADSLREIVLAKMWYTNDFSEFWDGPASHTYVYSTLSAICALPGWSVEFGARLCTFLFTISLFFVMFGLAKRFSVGDSIFWGLFLAAIDPYLIKFSFSVLTEPSYSVMIYLGFYVLWISLNKYKLWKSAVVGLIFGLAFAHRTEGIVFLVFIPIVLLINLLLNKKSDFNLKKFIIWTVVFVLGFSVFAVPQIWLVSSKMGKFALNGRQVWQDVLHNPDGKSEEQKIYGLDYSPKDINISYLQKHSAKYNLESSESIKHYAVNIFREFGKLQYNLIGEFFGTLGIILFGFGLFSLIKNKKYFELLILTTFLIFIVFPPLLHGVIERRLFVMIPIFLLIEGVGISFLLDTFKEAGFLNKRKIINETTVMLLTMIIVLIFSSSQFAKAMRHPTVNEEYNPEDYVKCISVLEQNKNERGIKTARIASRKGYLSYLADETQVPIPFADFNKLRTYCELNKINYVFLEYQRIQEFPFLENFKSGDTQGFTIIFSGLNSEGEKLELYAFNNPS